jgi:predicted branched-subunit amino acid permease
LIGHTALTVLMPIAFLALVVSYRAHRQPLALWLGAAGLVIAYVHIVGGTPEWTLYGVLATSLLAAVMDWRAAWTRRPQGYDALYRRVRVQ